MRVTRWFSGAGLVLLALVVLFSTLFTDWLFKSARIDLTESGLYTLSEGSKRIVQDLDQPLDLYFFFSQSATRDALAWRNYAKQVKELLQEFELASNGNLKLTVIDPEPFSEDEDRAAAFGLQAVPVNKAGDSLYFGLVAQYGAVKEGATPQENERSTLEIPFFQPERQAFLEYDVAKMIYQVSQPKKPVIGLISGLDVEGGFNMMTRQPTQPWATVTQLKQLFKVESLGNDVDEINPENYDLLVLIHPTGLSDATLFAIDQFVLRGGHTLIFVDPLAELSQPATPEDSRASDSLEPLFSAWGVEYDPTQFVADAQLALNVGGQGRQPVRHLGILQFGKDTMSRDNAVTSQLETLHMSSAGYFKPKADSETEFEPLIHSTEFAMPMATEKLINTPNPEDLAIGFQPTGEQYVTAVKLSGNVASAFPNGVPVESNSDETSADSSGDAEAEADSAASEQEYLTASQQPIQVVLVADTDILSDRLWVRVQQFFGQSIMQPFADNGDFFSNTVDLLSGSADLINIRGQGQYFRPFTLVKEMQREAESKFQAVEQQLRQRLQQIEAQLAELQNQQGDGGNTITLTPEVEAKLMQFQQEKLEVRKQLREVQHQLNKDIERLDLVLKLINIALVPFLITLVVLVIWWLRRRKAG